METSVLTEVVLRADTAPVGAPITVAIERFNITSVGTTTAGSDLTISLDAR